MSLFHTTAFFITCTFNFLVFAHSVTMFLPVCLIYDQEYVCLSNLQTAFLVVARLSTAVPSEFWILNRAVMVYERWSLTLQ